MCSDRDDQTAMETRYEMVVCEDGTLELRDRDDPDCWIATDSPIEIQQ